MLIKENIQRLTTSSILHENNAVYFSADIICSSKLSFLWALLSENCSHLWTDNGRLSVHNFAPNREYCLFEHKSKLPYQVHLCIRIILYLTCTNLVMPFYLFKETCPNFLLTCSGGDLRSSVVVVFKEAFVHSLVRWAKGWNEELPFHFFIILCGWVGWNNHSILTPL